MALVNGFDQAYTVQHLLQQVLNKVIPMSALLDSKTTFNCVAKSSSTMEKRLQIYAATIRNSLKNGELKLIGWIQGKDNPADGLTRDQTLADNHQLVILMLTNKVSPKGTGWMTVSN